jgi:magnesium and cobalt exporter, CNNM family
VTELLIILVLVLVNGLFSGAEIAVLSVRKTRLREFLRRKDARARAVQSLRDHPERFLATVQIGITVVSATAAAFGGADIADQVGGWLQGFGISARHADEIGFALVIAFISWLSLIIGELVPKSLALRYSDSYAFVVARPLLGLSFLMRPLVWFLTVCSNVILRMFGDRTNFAETRLSRDELQQLVEEAAKTGSVDPHTSEIASRALGFGEVTVAEVMVPRGRIVALKRGADATEVQRLLLEEGHSRMPVYAGNMDNIIGYVVARDVLALVWERQLLVFEDILRPLHVVSETSRAVELLKEMQRRRIQMAVVNDEHGGLSGLVTIEDLIEELVGDIFSEDEVPVADILREPAGTALVLGSVPVRKVNRELGLDLPVGADRTTVAGLCLSLAQSIPQAGERFTTEDGTLLEIVDASPRRVRKVRIHPVAQPIEAAEEAEERPAAQEADG